MKNILVVFAVVLVAVEAIHPMLRTSKRFPDVVDSSVTVPSDSWFTQILDHYNFADGSTWQQRYFVNDSFWNPDVPNSPIFVMIDGEGPASPYDVVLLQMSVYAQQYGALQFALEHRFYGKSQPFSDWSDSSLKYLSSEQALADLSYFIESMKQKYNVPDAPVITFGGSYSGNLAAWFRLKYPHITWGSVASSAPVQATLDFYQYLDVVDVSLSDVTGVQCDENIQKATNIIQSMLTTQSGQAQLQQMFNVCAPFQNDDDIATFMANLMGNWQGVVQYDGEGNPITIQTLCGIMNNGSDVLANYVKVNALFTNGQCMDCSYSDMIAQLTNTTIDESSGNRQWTYQTCIEFGYFQTTDSPNQPFGDLVPLSYYLQMCKDGFGFSFLPRVNETNLHYGAKKIRGTNILFVNGSIDPWHALGVLNAQTRTEKAVFIQGTAHCADMFPAKSSDPPGLAKAQETSSLQIANWLAQGNSVN